MKKVWYGLAGTTTFLFGLIWVLENLYFNVIKYLMTRGLNFGFKEVFVEGILGSSGIAIIFILPAIFYFKLINKKSNKLLDWSTSLALISGVIMLLFVSWVFYKKVEGIALGLMFLFVSIPAGILYGIALLLLIINWFKNK